MGDIKPTRNVISLTRKEMELAAEHGVIRQLYGIFHDLRHRAKSEGGEAWDQHIEGAIGEMVFCKWLRLPVLLNDHTFKSKRDAYGYEVRTRTKKWHEMIVRESDGDDHIFVMIVRQEDQRSYQVAGWMRGGEAKEIGEWKNPGEKGYAYFVPQNRLHRLSTLPLTMEMVEGQATRVISVKKAKGTRRWSMKRWAAEMNLPLKLVERLSARLKNEEG